MSVEQKTLRILTEHGSDGTHNQAAATTLQGKTGWYTGPTTQVSSAPYPANPGTTRAIGVTYHNLTGKTQRITVFANSSVASVFYAASDASATPTVVVDYENVDPAYINAQSLVFDVLPGNYYKVIMISGTPSLVGWVETN